MKKILVCLIFILTASLACGILSVSATAPAGEDDFAASEGTEISGSEEGIKINGGAYCKNLQSGSRIKAVFTIGEGSSGSAEIAFMRERNFPADIGKGFIPAEERGCGLYILFNDNEGYLNYCIKWITPEASLAGDAYQPAYIGDYMLKRGSRFAGRHSVEIRKSSTPGWLTGSELWIDGRKHDSFELLRQVVWDDMTDGGRGVIFGANGNFTVNNLAVDDLGKPLPNKFAFPEEIKVDEEFVFPEIVFTDDVDGTVEHRVYITDPNLIKSEFKAKTFIPEYEGLYFIEISSMDYSGNKYEDRVLVNASLKDGAPLMYFNNSPNPNGRVNEVYRIEKPELLQAEGVSPEVEVIGPSGEQVAVSDGSFIPGSTGEYRVVCSAENAVGTTKLMTRVYVKYNTYGGSPYEMFREKEHWAGNAGFDGQSVAVQGSAYCLLPFPMNEGIKIRIDLSDMPRDDSWIGLQLTSKAGNGKYATEYNYSGYYFLIKRTPSGSITYNMDWMSEEGFILGVAYDVFAGNTDVLELAVERKTSGETKTENINVYGNGTKNGNYELNYKVKYSSCVDNEDFTYIGISRFGGGTGRIMSVDINDNTAPDIRAEGLPSEAGQGGTVTLPEIKAIDAHDGEVSYVAEVYAPSGKEVAIEGGKFTAEETGVYYLIVKTADRSGNEGLKILEINVGGKGDERNFAEPGSRGKSCSGSILSDNYGVLLMIMSLFAALKIAGTGKRVVRRKGNDRE